MNSNVFQRGSMPLSTGQNNNNSSTNNLNGNNINQSSTLVNAPNNLSNLKSSSYNNNVNSVSNFQNSKPNLTPNKKAKIKYGKKSSSGSLLKSSRSSKFNKVIKNGIKIRNIDINLDSEDAQNEDTESVTSINKNNLNLLQSKLNSKGTGSSLGVNNIESLKASGQMNSSSKNFNNSQNLPLDSDETSSQARNNIILNNNQNSNLSYKSKPCINPQPLNNLNKNKTSSNVQDPNTAKKEDDVKSKKNESQKPNTNTFPFQPLSDIINPPKTNIVTPNPNLNQNINPNLVKNVNPNLIPNGNPNLIPNENPNLIPNKNPNLIPNKNPNLIQNTTPNLIQNINPNLQIIPQENYPISQFENQIQDNQPLQFTMEDIRNKKVGKGFRSCSELSQPGKDYEGNAKTCQDTTLISLTVGGFLGFNLFGILDGHGPHGHFVSKFCKDFFIKNMENYTEGLKMSMGITTTEELYNELKSSKFSYLTELYELADTELGTQDNFDYILSGTTCNIVFQFNKHLVCASVGDSRGILIYDKGDNTNQGIFPLSIDHKPNLSSELERIKLFGGVVDIIQDLYGNKIGPPRVFKAGLNHPGLAMSRSLGDIEAKEVGVIATPQIVEYEINESTKFLAICSDGVWEFVNNEQVRDLGNQFYPGNDVIGFCHNIVSYSIALWEQNESIRDDISIVSVFF